MTTASYPLLLAITRPDGNKLYINTAQIIYVMQDVVDESKKRTEIVTTQGSFIINKPVNEVLAIISGEKRGEL